MNQTFRKYSLITLFFFSSISYAVAQPKKVVLQAFWWNFSNSNYPQGWANYLVDLAPRLRDMGIDAVWIPVSQKNDNPFSNGYSPFDHYDLGDKFQKGRIKTPLGDKDEFLRMIAVMHANGIQVIQDVVYNHCDGAGSGFSAGGQDSAAIRFYNSNAPLSNYADIPRDPSNGFKTFRYVSFATPATDESATNYLNRNGRWSKNWQNFFPNPSDNRYTGSDLTRTRFGPDLAYNSGSIGQATLAGYNPPQSGLYNRDQLRANLIWFKKQTGVDGFRLDAVKHFPTDVQEDILYNVQFNSGFASGGNDMFAVGEWVGGNSEMNSWCNAVQNRAGTFDFALRGFSGTSGLYSMVYGLGGYDLSNLPAAQQSNRGKTVSFVNNHDTFRPTLRPNGNYPTDTNGNQTRWSSNDELSPNIDPREPRLACAYAVACAVDGSHQIFFEDLFDIGTRGNRYNHNPKSDTSLRVRDDIAFLAKCHKVMDWKAASYFVPFTSADHLILERDGKAIIGVNDNYNTWQGNWITTQFPAGTRLKDYGGSSGASDIRVVALDRRVQISTPPCNGTARRRGISVWAPEGLHNIDTAIVPANRTTTQEWELSDDLGDSNPLSLMQGGALPARSKAIRTAGKIYAKAGSTVTYKLFTTNHRARIKTMITSACGTVLDSIIDTGNVVKNYVVPSTGWYVLKARNETDTVSTKNTVWVNVTYEAPQEINARQALSFSPPFVNLGPDRKACGSNTIFSPLQISGGVTLRWTYPSGRTSTSQNISLSQTGIYTLTVTNGGGCSFTDSVLIERVAVPSSTITQRGDTLFAPQNNDFRYSWSLDGNLLINDTLAQLLASAPGTYRLVVSSKFGCAASNSSITITSVVPKIDEKFISINPNPAHGLVKVQLPIDFGDYSVSVISATGQVISNTKMVAGENMMNTSSLTKGMYQIRFSTEKASGTKRLIIN